jgi:hypothetical protein
MMKWLGIIGWVLVATLSVLIYFRPTFDAGWQAGRCYDWESMNQMPKYYGFDRSKIFDTERESFEKECDAVASWSRK